MSHRRAVPFALATGALALVASLEACVGDEPELPAAAADSGVDSGASSSGTSGSSGTARDASTPENDGGTSGGLDAADGDVVDASTLPTVACVDQPTGNAGFTTCLANAPSVTPQGNLLVPATYRLAQFWRNGGCGTDENKNLGAASIFEENGKIFMRHKRLGAPSDGGAVAVTVTGTYWLQVDGNTLTRTEVCDPARLGAVEVGDFEQVAGAPTKLRFKTASLAEVWDQQ